MYITYIYYINIYIYIFMYIHTSTSTSTSFYIYIIHNILYIYIQCIYIYIYIYWQISKSCSKPSQRFIVILGLNRKGLILKMYTSWLKLPKDIREDAEGT